MPLFPEESNLIYYSGVIQLQATGSIKKIGERMTNAEWIISYGDKFEFLEAHYYKCFDGDEWHIYHNVAHLTLDKLDTISYPPQLSEIDVILKWLDEEHTPVVWPDSLFK